jgi:hypothetical protein
MAMVFQKFEVQAIYTVTALAHAYQTYCGLVG